jgi:soluble lytic murein transglycosylase-like protein
MRFRRWPAIALLVMAWGASSASDTIYVSYDGNGFPSYSTQPYNNRYVLFLQGKSTTGSVAGKYVKSHGSVSGRARLAPAIKQAAADHDIDPALVSAIIDVESGFNAQAVSPKGAKGAMQLLPATANAYGVTDIMDPQQNIQAGTKYLKDLLVAKQGNLVLALAAYNAGPGSVSRHSNRIPSYSETMLYVPRVLARMAVYRGEDVAIER